SPRCSANATPTRASGPSNQPLTWPGWVGACGRRSCAKSSVASSGTEPVPAGDAPAGTGRGHAATGGRYISCMVEVRLRAVRVDLQSNTPVLLLQETEGLGRTLPIFIGAPEATAIAFALQGMDTPR